MSYSLSIREEAVLEYTEAYIWYEEQQDGLGNSFKIAINEKLKKICNNPLHYKITYKNYHEALTDRFPFLIVYTIDNELKQILVAAIFHTSRNPREKYKFRKL